MVKLNSFVLPHDVIRKMKDKLIDTEKTDLEQGFNLCRKPASNVLIDRMHCTGDECSISFKRTCGRPEEILVGDYHTHPIYSANPSLQDMISSYDLGFGCIGSVEDNEIYCFVRKDKVPDPKVISDIRNTIETYEKPLEKMTFGDILAGKAEHLETKLIDSAHYYRDHYFKKINIKE